MWGPPFTETGLEIFESAEAMLFVARAVLYSVELHTKTIAWFRTRYVDKIRHKDAYSRNGCTTFASATPEWQGNTDKKLSTNGTLLAL